MGGVLDWVSEFVGGIIGLPFVWLENVFGVTFLSPIIESIMGFLGFEDEDIYQTDIIAIRVFNEDLWTQVQKDLHLEYMKLDGYGAIDYAMNFSKSGDSQFGRYYRTGRWDYLDYLPEGQINAVSLDVSGIEQTLETKEGTDVFIVNIGNRTPTDEMWAKYQLQELYSYNIGTDAIQYTDGQWYKYTSVAYQSSNNTFNVTLDTIPIIDAKTYKATTVTVTPINSTTDNKNTLITEDILYTDNVTGNVLYETSTVISNTNEQVPKDTVSNSYTNEFVSEVNNIITPNTITINIPNHANVQHYIVEYTRTDTGQFKYWIYNPASNQYPISNPNQKSNNFEMFPVVMLRNNKKDIASYDKDSIRYKQTTKMLKSVGVDLQEITDGYAENPDIDNIQDAFFLLAVSPSDTNPIVSRYLYEMFDAIYDTTPFVDVNTAYSMSIKEEPYNAALVWNTGDVSVYDGTIYSGALAGDCNHEVRTFTTTTNTYFVQIVTALDNNIWNPRISVQQYTQKEILLDSVIQNTEISNAHTFTTYRTLGNSDGSFTSYEIGTTKTLTTTTATTESGMRIQKQITKTTYKRIDIRNFHAVNVVRSDRPRGVALDVTDKDLIIPLALPVVARLTLEQKTALLGRSVHLLFYAVQHTHLEWYETEKFSKALQMVMIVIMIVVTIVVTVVTWGSGTAATITAMGALYTALEIVVIAVAVQLALKLIAKYVDDPALKAALSAVVMVVGAWAGGAFSIDGLLTALTLSACCVQAADIYMGTILKEGMEGFESDVKGFTSEYEQRVEQQETALKGLDMGSAAFDMVDLSTNIEMFSSNGMANRRQASASLLSPSQFYYLATNQAAYNYDLMYSGLYDNAVHNFVTNKLQLGVPGV